MPAVINALCLRLLCWLQLLYVDTEGFESTGRSNTYDDRVFAVATVLSSLLVYNLPETIRGSDVSKLSFVVELAAGFYNKGDQVCSSLANRHACSQCCRVQHTYIICKIYPRHATFLVM